MFYYLIEQGLRLNLKHFNLPSHMKLMTDLVVGIKRQVIVMEERAENKWNP